MNNIKQLIQFQDIFPDSPPKTSWIKPVDIGDVGPIKQHPYWVNPVKDAAMAKEVDYMLKHDIIEPSSSSWSSPCILVAKPDGSNRFVTDFRRVNSVTNPGSSPIPRLLYCIDKNGNAKYISVFYCLKGYWQPPLTDHAREVSAFCTPRGLWQYKVWYAEFRRNFSALNQQKAGENRSIC